MPQPGCQLHMHLTEHPMVDAGITCCQQRAWCGTCRMELLKAGGIEMLPMGAGLVAANTAGSVGGIIAAATVYVCCCWNAAGMVCVPAGAAADWYPAFAA